MTAEIFNKILYVFFKWWLKGNTKGCDFTILSNNCWAGHIYQDLDVKYLSPTAGLYFMASDYVRFLSNLEHYLNCELNFIDQSRFESERKKSTLRKKHPIGLLDDIEIHFLHYQTEEEAKQKWVRRSNRINKDKIYIKMDDQNGCTYEDILAFDKLPFKNKVFFSSKYYPEIESLVYLPYYKNKKNVGSLHAELWSFIFRFNLVKWLNSNMK